MRIFALSNHKSSSHAAERLWLIRGLLASMLRMVTRRQIQESLSAKYWSTSTAGPVPRIVTALNGSGTKCTDSLNEELCSASRCRLCAKTYISASSQRQTLMAGALQKMRRRQYFNVRGKHLAHPYRYISSLTSYIRRRKTSLLLRAHVLISEVSTAGIFMDMHLPFFGFSLRDCRCTCKTS